MIEKKIYETHSYSLVICRNFDGKWLCVRECGNQGWWIAGGYVEPGEDLYTAALRETEEEAGIKIEIKGVLRIEHTPRKNYGRMRVIFFAVPLDDKQKVKKIPDGESEEAEWFTLEEIIGLKNKKPGWRGSELYDWPFYIENGGVIIPTQYLTSENNSLSLIRFNNFLNFEEQLNIKPTGNQKKDITSESFIESINNQDIEYIKMALVNGFNPNIPINKKLWSPLHQACKYNNLELINMLLLYNANIDAVTHRNRNCLNFAVQENLKILNSFLMKMTELEPEAQQRILNRQDLDDGDTSLHTIAKIVKKGSQEHQIMYKVLINFGADENIKNNAGNSSNDILNY